MSVSLSPSSVYKYWIGSHQSRFVGRCVKTRQINLSAIRKVKLKEHGLLKQKEKREPSGKWPSEQQNLSPGRNDFSKGGNLRCGGADDVRDTTMGNNLHQDSQTQNSLSEHVSDLSLEQQNNTFFILKT